MSSLPPASQPPRGSSVMKPSAVPTAAPLTTSWMSRETENAPAYKTKSISSTAAYAAAPSVPHPSVIKQITAPYRTASASKGGQEKHLTKHGHGLGWRLAPPARGARSRPPPRMHRMRGRGRLKSTQVRVEYLSKREEENVSKALPGPISGRESCALRRRASGSAPGSSASAPAPGVGLGGEVPRQSPSQRRMFRHAHKCQGQRSRRSPARCALSAALCTARGAPSPPASRSPAGAGGWRTRQSASAALS